jgi:hypothetical protein
MSNLSLGDDKNIVYLCMDVKSQQKCHSTGVALSSCPLYFKVLKALTIDKLQVFSVLFAYVVCFL